MKSYAQNGVTLRFYRSPIYTLPACSDSFIQGEDCYRYLGLFLFCSRKSARTAYLLLTKTVTGASSGLGLEACRSLINLGAAQVILTCRNLEKGVAAAKNIQASTGSGDDVLKVWFLNLSDYESVKAFARKVEGELERVDIVSAPPPSLLYEQSLCSFIFYRPWLCDDGEMMITLMMLITTNGIAHRKCRHRNPHLPPHPRYRRNHHHEPHLPLPPWLPASSYPPPHRCGIQHANAFLCHGVGTL